MDAGTGYAHRVAFWDALDKTDPYGPVREMTIARVGSRDVDEFCRRWHYAKHGGSMSWCYGIYDGLTLAGVASYNLPTMSACQSVFGPDRWEWVAHLGRLVCAEDAPKNTESRLIAGSLKLLKEDRPIVRAVLTFAAPSAGHIGTIYQATNALYTGTSTPSHHYRDTNGYRRAQKQGHNHDGVSNVSMAKAIALGWSIHREPGKHRYIYLVGTKTERKEARALLRWPVLPYPRADAVA